MSGIKTYSVSGTSPNAASATGALVATAVTGGVAIVAGAAVLAVMATAQAAQAYMERKERERQAIIDRETEIQRKIATLRAQSQSRRKPIVVQSPVQTEQTPKSQTEFSSPIISPSDSDRQQQVRGLVAQLPKIKTDYEKLIEQGYLDAASFQSHWVQIEGASQRKDLGALRSSLGALDNARIQVLESLQQQWADQFQYLEERLNVLSDRLPQAIVSQFQENINNLKRNTQAITEDTLFDLHQQITEAEAQSDRALTAAQDLMAAWQAAGYTVHMLPGTDDGDVEIEIATHEGASTRMRVQYYGQQLDFFGPSEESASCAARTQEALRLFQEQGYQLEWSSWDGQPVPEEWRYIYSAQPEEDQTKAPPASLKTARAMEKRGY